MLKETFLRTAAILLCIATLVIIFSAMAGCAAVKEIDGKLWGTSPDPNTPQQGFAPPIIELIAGTLAAIGYPGMAYWIHRNRKNGTAKIDALALRLEDLEQNQHADIKG